MLSRLDLINRHAERMEEELNIVRIRRSDTTPTLRPGGLLDSKVATLWRRLVEEPMQLVWTGFINGASVQSPLHRLWLWFTLSCTVYMAFLVPYRISVDSLERETAIASVLKALEIICEVEFVLDIWFSWRLKESTDAMELYEQSPQQIYRRERLMWDIIAAVPLDRLLTDFTQSSYLRLLRCPKAWNIVSYMGELNRRSVSTELNRFRGVCLVYSLAIFWTACSYLAISEHAGFGGEWSGWRPSATLEISGNDPSSNLVPLRLLRGLFFGTTAFVKKDKTFTPDPDSTLLFIFAVLMCFIGMLVMSFMIGEIAALFISYIWNEVAFRKNHVAVELFLARAQVSMDLKRRAQRYMSSLWSSHSGVNFEMIFEEMPAPIRRSAIMHIVQRPLRLFVSSTFRLLACDSKNDIEVLIDGIAQSLRFEGYPRDENVVTEGNISKAMHFIVKGHLCMSSVSNPAIVRVILRKGHYFGDCGLLGCAVSPVTVKTVRACDLLSLNSETLQQLIEANVFTNAALEAVQCAQESFEGQERLAGSSRKEMEEECSDSIVLPRAAKTFVA